ncbi:MAG: alpha/beta hydrolase [Myxococcota bacterium]
MTASAAFLVFSLLSLVLSSTVYSRIRLVGALLVPTFFLGWLRGELVLWTLVVEATATAAFVANGALSETGGPLGLLALLASWGLLLAAHRRSVDAGRTFADALAPAGLSVDRGVSVFHGFPNPFAFGHPDVKRIHDIAYGASLPGDKGGRNLLDLVLPEAARAGDRRPVLLQVHGGAWVIGDKREQGRPLMREMASRGWICVAINYRLSPKGTMPDHIVDVKRSIAWIREHIAEYGGDPDFVCITGGSAGGHLSSLAALTANDPRFQPGFEQVDTRLAAAVPFYGVFDLLDRAGDRKLGKMADALGPLVFKCTPEENPELWDSVCPIVRVHAEAPPFFVIQGAHDSLVMAEEAVTFVDALREKSNAPVLFAELEGAQHAFEIFQSPRTEHAVLAVAAFLERVRSEGQAAI